WEGDDPAEDRRVTYRELHESVCRLANALKARGVKKGDRVTIYLPMIPEAAVAMLACARIGAIHSVVFGGFSPDSLAGRIEDCRSTVLITADEGLRGGRKVPLKRNADTALKQCPEVKTVIVVKRTGGDIDWVKGRDDGDVRGRAELSRSVALLAGRRQAQGVDLLHRADRDPRVDARGRGLRPQDRPQISAPPRHGRRTDQSGSLALVLRPCRRQA